ncbi:hypothetical protein [Autumnicola musiva]|uniref:Uncharacterized protein n=1 Tax=Autumnicola musiva TaxID=3075589 RepID=A0ABU3DBM6_9FLAO|nr:hypothetical protein [Zunongwangia sp. F117]MDT0678770.1 hypothetical protein [Zunongwangia sp. F117]
MKIILLPDPFEYESLGAIQEKALKVLEGFMLNPKTELLDLFDQNEEE